jgi:hypothetical protein
VGIKMGSYTNALSTTGAFIVSVGSGIISYNLYSASKDSVIANTAVLCKTIVPKALEYTKSLDGSLNSIRYLFPNVVAHIENIKPITENVTRAVCDVTIQLNTYSLLCAVGAGLVAVGALTYALSRCVPVKIKQD